MAVLPGVTAARLPLASLQLNDTIVAVSTPAGRGGLGVLRLSGPAAAAIAGAMVKLRSPLRSWKVSLGDLLVDDLLVEEVLVDEVLVSYFQAPRSYTGEDVVEISCHGSPVVLQYALDLAASKGARLAEPGEFTLRAFLRGRIDLPRAEAVHDLIESTTLYQARVAAQQLQGSVSRRLQPVKDHLLELIALLEAGIDFAEDDISVASGPQILARLDPIRESLTRLVASYQYGGLVRSGFSLAVVGRPNVGKSSLFNRLLRQDRAIVTDIPGTTRDLVAETADFAGIPVRLVDTAGLRETGETIERLGIERSYQAMADADLTLVVLDLSRPRTPEDEALLARAREQGRYLVAANKSDLPALWPAGDAIPVSAQSGAGVDQLRQRAIEVLAPAAGLAPDDGLITSSRQFNHLRKSLQAIEKTRLAVAAAVPHEFVLVDLYDALQPLDNLTGSTTADDILNRIFSTFCIGK